MNSNTIVVPKSGRVTVQAAGNSRAPRRRRRRRSRRNRMTSLVPGDIRRWTIIAGPKVLGPFYVASSLNRIISGIHFSFEEVQKETGVLAESLSLKAGLAYQHDMMPNSLEIHNEGTMAVKVGWATSVQLNEEGMIPPTMAQAAAEAAFHKSIGVVSVPPNTYRRLPIPPVFRGHTFEVLAIELKGVIIHGFVSPNTACAVTMRFMLINGAYSF
nr:MAG: hypothetical protein [Grapevine umbra-like virus 2]